MFNGRRDSNGAIKAFYISRHQLENGTLQIANRSAKAQVGKWCQATTGNGTKIIEPAACRYGFHGSRSLKQAQAYCALWPGVTVCIVELAGFFDKQHDKIAATFRKILYARTIKTNYEVSRLLNMKHEDVVNWVKNKKKKPSNPTKAAKKVQRRDALGRFC